MKILSFCFAAIPILAGAATCSTTSGGGAGGEACARHPECCDEPHTPCKGLSLEECKAHAYCGEVKGRPWNEPDASLAPFACGSNCGQGWNAAQTCVYEPSDPATCYLVDTGQVPDGWTEIFDCDIPAGLCGK